MGYLGRRIGLSQDQGDSNPGAAGGAVGGGLLDLFAHGYFEQQGDIYNAPGVPESGLTATGGVISDYTSGSNVYRAHVFTSSGTFDVTALGTFPAAVDYLVVAGGGGGGGGVYAGGGGAGGLRTNLNGHPLSTNNPSITVSTSPGSYTVTIGGGGNGGAGTANDGINGTNSVFSTITSHGGGGGRGRTNNGPGLPGGSGGGQSYGPGPQGYGYNPSTPAPVLGAVPLPNPYTITQGQDGGFAPDSTWYGTGGGGAGQQGSGQNDGPLWPAYGYPGGDGVQVYIAGPPTNTGIGQTSSWFAGGGGGGGPHASPVLSLGGAGGGGVGGSPAPNVGAGSGLYSTGGGGGGAQPQSPAGTGSDLGGSGGSGVVVVRYKIAELTATAKATGGAISFYGGKTIHAFTNSGTFATASNWSAGNVEYVVVGGGGGSNTEDLGGAGGAGGFITGTTPIGSHPVSTTIQVGAGGRYSIRDDRAGTSGTPSYFGTPLTGYGGGGGAGKTSDPLADAIPGGSGGGGDHGPNAGAPGDKQTGTSSAAPITPQGYPGGDGASPHGTGGGGGAGGAGGDGANPYTGGAGGLGRQSPSTFRDPISTLGAPGPTGSVPGTNPGGDTSGKFWFAGGGGGGVDSGTNGGGGGGAAAGASFAGGGYGGHDPGRIGTSGTQSTGGGGGATDDGGVPGGTGSGGSGIVLIAYPS